MSETELPRLKPYHPMTFQERGVAVPFTTPLLGGTRARPTDKQRVELVIPNPAGGRGVYIMPWAGIAAWCQPTLHDSVFNDRIASLKNVTPAAIRRVALQLSAEGLAGEEAMEAACQAVNLEKGDRLVTNYQLLMTLVEQVGGRFAAQSTTNGSGKPDLMTQARLTVEWISPRLGRTASWTATALEALSDVLTNIGVGPSGATGRLPRLLAMLRNLRTAMAEWSATRQNDDQVEYVSMACTVADLTLSLAQATLAQAQALTGDMVRLLRNWGTDPGSISQLATRPEWLLDGWEQICLIWNHARDDAGRRAALVEIIGLIPILPKEASEWSEIKCDMDRAIRFRRLVSLNEDWRTGSIVFELIARNEHLRAIACRPA
ncbi:hypothetical protein [Acidisphaera sp. S103]|uniref:hypothetical protein n=1 Tax=Acidisphaera sp. S103 TaxID=1747223 RepID=UPI00131E18C1|nr:hypothetical protein [Acidisphaera sp. S103]